MAKNKKYEDTHFEEYLESQTIVDVDIEQRMRDAFIDYAMSVIVSRALPDVRDGLKPVHRRILYAMYEEHLTNDKPFFKSATTVGNVIGRYHPHGDASAYDALVRMAQDFSLRYPLIDGHGNFGSVDGDPPAAYRYTEARMSKIANALLENIDKNTVDFAWNMLFAPWYSTHDRKHSGDQHCWTLSGTYPHLLFWSRTGRRILSFFC